MKFEDEFIDERRIKIKTKNEEWTFCYSIDETRKGWSKNLQKSFKI